MKDETELRAEIDRLLGLNTSTLRHADWLLERLHRAEKALGSIAIQVDGLLHSGTGRCGYEQGLERAAVIAETMLAKKSYRSVGVTIAAAIRAEGVGA